MSINFISADQRLAEAHNVNIVICGPAGAGKTSQARTLPPESTLFIDLEGGTQALADWPGTVVKVREEAQKAGIHPWEYCRYLACLISGPDPAAATDRARASYFYSREKYEEACQNIAPPAAFDPFKIIYWDSLTVAGRWSYAWAQLQPEATSEKTKKYDGLAVYGRHGQEMVTWFTTIQHTPKKSTVVSCILDSYLDDFKRQIFAMQIDGSKAGNELPGIFDEVLTLGLFRDENGQPIFDLQKGTERAFVCHLNNGFGLPAKDRSGRLDLLEPPNLGAIMRKIASAPRKDAMVTGMSPAVAA